jgi:hypothetical protein
MTRKSEDSALSEWPAVGDVVVDWNYSRGHRMVVKKITPTQVVATSGKAETRYRRRDLSRVGGGAWDHSTLIPVNDKRFVDYEHKQRRNSLAHKVTELMADFRRDDCDDAAHEAIKELAAYIAGTSEDPSL